MTELLLALGSRPSSTSALRFVAAVLSATACMLLAGIALTELLGVPAAVVQGGAWLLWLTWLGAVFPRDRLVPILTRCPYPYRLAFARELLPGIGCNFALLLRPAVHGLLASEMHRSTPPTLLLGGALALAGAALIGAGIHAIGVARTFFVYEYVEHRGTPVIRGIYRSIRHPLFLGGITISMGLAIAVGDPGAIALAAINVCVLPAYVLLEDRRCSKVMGDPYSRYRTVSGAVVPRSWRR
jgi:protein-S-isoprenylcysteine O-methyltransferase Ste14